MMSVEHRTNERTCVGCGKRAESRALVRLVLAPDDAVVVDAAGGGFGRGAHVHSSRACLAKAKGGLSRAFKRDVQTDAQSLEAAIRDAFERRAAGILLGARGAGHLALGADAARDAMNEGAPLVVLASDAGSVSKSFERAIAQGRAASFGTKASLGELFKTGETAVFAVRHAGVARALQDAFGIGQVSE